MLSQAAMAPALFVLGASGFTLYPVAMAWACEKVEHHQLVAMNQALLMSYTIGSLLGPTLTAMLMQNFSDNLLFIMIASVSFYLSADPAAQSRASSDAGGARLTLQRAAHAARHLLQSHRLTAAERTSRFS